MSITYSEPGVLNAVEQWIDIGGTYYGLKAGDNSSATALRNSAVLQGIIELAQAYYTNSDAWPSEPFAATILIPGNSSVPPPGPDTSDDGSQYFFQVPSGASAAITIDCNWPLRFIGTGNVKLVMVLDPTTNDSGDLFAIQNNGKDNTGGMTFEDLTFQYPSIPNESSPPPEWAAIHLLSGGGAQNIRINRCNFLDCPIGLWAQDGLQISVFQSYIAFTEVGNVGTAIWLGDTIDNDAAGEVLIAACVLAVVKNGQPAPPRS